MHTDGSSGKSRGGQRSMGSRGTKTKGSFARRYVSAQDGGPEFRGAGEGGAARSGIENPRHEEVVGVKGTRSCLFTGWMVSCVLVARKLKGLWKRACLVKETKAYSVLDPEAKICVKVFLDRVDPAKQVHIGRYPPKTDPSMAADFVLDMTRTDDRGVCLYRGMVITARILDLVQAPPGTPLSHMEAIRTVYCSVDPHESTANAGAFESPAMKPGFGLGMTVGIVKEYFREGSKRPLEQIS